MTQGELELDRHYIKRLEQRIAEYEEFYIHRNEAQYIQDKNTGEMLEYIKELSTPKPCEGCKHIDSKGSCYDCSRYYIDYYEPKDTKCQIQLN